MNFGPRDIENNACVIVRRDTNEKINISLNDISKNLQEILEDIQKNMYEECKSIRQKRTNIAHNIEEFEKYINENQGYVKTMWCGNEECENKIKELTGAHSRCIPFEQEKLGNTCVCCGKEARTHGSLGKTILKKG